MLITLSITWLLVRTSPDEVMTIPVPATLPLWLAVVALMSTVAASTLATAASEAEIPLPVGALLGAPPPLLPDGRLAVDGWVRVALVTAQAVPPPAPRHTTASPAMRNRRTELERPRPDVDGGHCGGPQSGCADQ